MVEINKDHSEKEAGHATSSDFPVFGVTWVGIEPSLPALVTRVQLTTARGPRLAREDISSIMKK